MDERRSTSTKTNKQLARSFFQLPHDGDVEGAVALLDPDGEIQQMMHRKFWPVVGWPVPADSGPYPVMPMEGFRTELRSLGEAFDCQTFRFVVDEVIAEGDRVVLTVHNEGQYPDGDPYEMGYCFIFTIRDGKIVHAIEYDPGGVNICGVNEIDAGVERASHDRNSVFYSDPPVRPEHHRAETQRRNGDSRVADDPMTIDAGGSVRLGQ